MVSTLTNETTVCRVPPDTWDVDTAEATVVGVPGRLIMPKGGAESPHRKKMAAKLGFDAYGATKDDAIARVQALALRVVADRLEQDEAGTELLNITFAAA